MRLRPEFAYLVLLLFAALAIVVCLVLKAYGLAIFCLYTTVMLIEIVKYLLDKIK